MVGDPSWRRPFLHDLPSADAADLVARLDVRDVPAGRRVLTEGSQDDTAAIVLAGRVKLVTSTPSGRETLLAICGAGEILGELALIHRRPRTASAVALQPTRAGYLAGPAMRAWLAERPGAQQTLLRHLAATVHAADRERAELWAVDALARVRARIVALADEFLPELADGQPIELPITQEDLASWTATSRETTSRALRQLRGLGWISTARGTITVHDLESLRDRPARGRQTA